ncbi:MAG: pantothenate kinase [Elainellaceae cyanobacterium]
MALSWLALVIGNSRLHWAWFIDSRLKQTWDTPHLSTEAVTTLIAQQFNFHQLSLTVASEHGELFPHLPYPLPLWIASVVPSQTMLWQSYPHTHYLTLDQIPLQALYPTLGVDRALALWGAICTERSPALVIDAGTALTLTGADADAKLVGGAILPGLGLQLRSLTEHTAALPGISRLSATPLTRWATNTPEAMVSGIIYSLVAGIEDFVQDWRQQFPDSTIVLTGGDGATLYHYWQQQHPETATLVKVDANLVFWGVRAVLEKSAL